MADEADSKSVVGNHVWVQVPSPAVSNKENFGFPCFFIVYQIQLSYLHIMIISTKGVIMKRRKRQQNDLLTFLGGLAMLVAGLYWLTTRVTVSTSFFGGGFSFGGMNINSGLVVVPFIASIVWLFVNPDSFMAKICTGLSILLIIAAIIMSTHLHMRSTSLYEYLIMLVFIFGGGALVLKVLCNPKYKDFDKRSDYDKRLEEIENLADELEELKRNMK